MANNGIQIENSPNILIITDSDQNQITVTQPVVGLVEVSALGPQGQKGDQGDSIFQLVSGSTYSTTSSLEVSGSFTVSGSSTFKNIGPAIFSGSVESTQGFTGSLFGTSSYALTASYAMNGGSGGGGYYIATGSVSASVGLETGSFVVTSGSSNLFTLKSDGTFNFAFPNGASGLAQAGNGNVTATYFNAGLDIGAGRKVSAPQIIATSEFTSSAALITGNVTVLGTASINTLIVNQTQLSTGSNQLGDSSNDFQTLYGTVRIPTGSLTVTGSTNITFTENNNNTPRFVITNNGTGNSSTFQVNAGGSGNPNIGFGVAGTSKATLSYNISTDTFALGNLTYSVQDFMLFLNSNGSLQFKDPQNSSTVRFQVLSNGNTNIAGNLTITGSATNSLSVKGSGTTSATTALSVQNSNASSSLVVLDSGRVGIGTTNPTSSFEVVAGSDANGIKLRGRSADNISNLFFASNDGLSQYGYFQHRSTVMRMVNNVGDIEFWNGPGIDFTLQRATLFSTGNFVVNSTTDAGFRLDVNGTGRFSGNLTITGSATNSLLVRGSGATSATNALLVQNSSGTQGIAVRDDGVTITNEIRPSYININNVFQAGGGNRSVFGTFPGDNSAELTINSTTRGFLPPRTNLLSNISNPVQGLITYLTSSGNEGLYYYNSGSYQGWTEILNNSGSQNITGSLSILGIPSTSSAALLVYKSGSTVVDVQGSSGQLFSITDSLTGSLFSVNTVAGLPVMEAFSDNTVNIGKFGVYPIKVAATGTLAIITGSLFGSATTASYVNPLTQSVFISSSNATQLQVGNNLLFVSSSGRVGIGTGNPLYVLDISGSVRVSGSGIILASPPATTISISKEHTGGGSTSTNLNWVYDTLSVNNSSTGTFFYFNGYYGTVSVRTTTGQAVNAFGIKGLGTTSATNALQVYNSAESSIFIVRDDGNVGIGTSTPNLRLDVSGSSKFAGNIQITGSTIISGSAGTGSALTVYKSGSTVVDIQGSQGQLFSITDSLSGSLFSVSNISGLPILEVFSDSSVVMGSYTTPAMVITGSNTIISGSLRGRVVTLSTASATASMDCSLSNFFDLTLSGSMYLTPVNIQPGETINLRITQPAISGSLNYSSSIKFPNGLPYTASATASVVDLISFISFDSSTLYATALKNLV